MSHKNTLAKTLVIFSTLALFGNAALAKDDRLRCRDEGAGGREADLRFEEDDGDNEFRAKWEIDLDQGQVEGDVVNVTIDGVFIGGITLFQKKNELEGDIEFEGDDFPSDFPSIKEGTPVEIGALFCRFERD